MLFPQVSQFRHFFRLFIPLLLTQIAQIGTSVFSSIFSGQAGTVDLAGVAVAVNIWLPIFTAFTGIFYGVTPIIAQLRGAEKYRRIPKHIIQSLYIAAFLTIVIIALGTVLLEPFLSWMSLEPAVHRIASGYLQALALGIFPIFMIATMRNIIDAHGKTHVSMCLLLVNLALTIILFRLFIFGGPGIPAMGGVGTAYALTVAAWITFFLFLAVFHSMKPFSLYHLWSELRPVQRIYWLAQLKLGLPMSIAIFCETSLFSIVSLLMNEYGTVYLAANQAAISYANLIYTIPWSISLTATIVVGYEIGAQNYKGARQYALLCQMTALSIACFTAFATYTWTDTIASWFTSEADTLLHIRIFLMYALCFTFFDALGTPVQGILRGYKDVKSITYIAFMTYWVISLPMGYGIAHETTLGAYGYWLGLIISLAIAAILYNSRLWLQTTRKYR